MDPYEMIMTRRSIRRYRLEPVPQEMLEKIVSAAMNAPSAGNEQPWHFMVITDRKLLDEIPHHHPYSHMLHEAPAAILVCGDERLEAHQGYWAQDCSAATENMLLAAHALGLGAVWVGVYPEQKRIHALRELLALPEEITPFALVAIGYAAEYLPAAQRFLANRVHYNKW